MESLIIVSLTPIVIADTDMIKLCYRIMQIQASEINFWTSNFNLEELTRRHKLNMYPPRMKMIVVTQPSDHNLILPVKFEGCSDDSRLNMDLIFPLGIYI